MKKKRKNLLRLSFSFIIFLIFSTCLFSYNFEIKEYSVDIELYKDRTVYVSETIHVNFLTPRHGIFRFIPYRYKNGIFNDNLRIQVISIESSYHNEPFHKEPYKVFKRGRNLIIKIGKKGKLFEGEKVYKIEYIVENVIKDYKNFNEFYYNVIGTNWNVPINNASFKISFPEIKSNNLYAKIFTGRFGQRIEIKDFTLTEDYLELNYPLNLPPKTGITVTLAFPEGIFNSYLFKKILWFITDNFGLFLPFLSLILMFLIWWYAGRDEKLGTVVVEYYPPEDITPAEAGTIIDDKVDLRDVISTILSLADKGYLKIVKEEKELFFEKLKDSTEKLKPHEKTIFEGIFQYGDKVSLSQLKGSFFYTIEKASSYLYDLLTKKEHIYSANPDEIRNLFKNIGRFISFFGIIVFFYGLTIARWDLGIGLIISGIIVIIFSRYMPQKTHKGAEIYRKIVGFKEFMERVEKPVIEKLVKEDENYFSKTLPYAIAFNIEKNWLKKFEGIDFKIPEWYIYPGVTGYYSPLMFYSLLFSDLNSMHESFSFVPEGESSFSTIDITGGGFDIGGGFSGGGFGGGGGGSW